MDMTLREIDIVAEGRNKRDLERWKQGVQITHLGEKLRRAKKLPRLAELLPRPAPVTTVEERRKGFWDVVRHMARPGELKERKRGG